MRPTPNQQNQQLPSRLSLLNYLESTGISWGTQINNEVEQKIFESLRMVEKDFLVSNENVPLICKKQSVSEHLSWVIHVWEPYIHIAQCGHALPDYENQKGSPPFEGYEEGYKYVLTARQMHCYKATLLALDAKKVQVFFHEFRDFIYNYRKNIHQPINPAERKALAAMIHYYKETDLL